MNNLITFLKEKLKVAKILLLLVAIASPLGVFAHPPAPSNINSIGSHDLAAMLRDATPAVVNITVKKEIPVAVGVKQGQSPIKPDIANAIAVGSGVIIDAQKGYIITNAHVIKNQKLIVVTLKSGQRYTAKLIGMAEGYDLAVIQIHASGLKQMPIANSNNLQVGNSVVAIGSPYGLTQTVTSGVVSALHRQEPHLDKFQNFIQTDAPINPGNSGGALINLRGQLVGINTAIVTPSSGNIGIGFAIPSNLAHEVSAQLIKYGKIEPGMLGVLAQNLTSELASAMGIKVTEGAIVAKVVPFAPAAKSGIKDGDVITHVNGELITSSAQLHNLLGVMRPGTKITIGLIRQQHHRTITVAVGNPKQLLKTRMIPFFSGVELRNYSAIEPDSTMLDGVLVTNIRDNSSAALGGLLPGDVVISANGTNTPNLKKLLDVATSNPRQLLLKVARGNGQMFLVIRSGQ